MSYQSAVVTNKEQNMNTNCIGDICNKWGESSIWDSEEVILGTRCILDDVSGQTLKVVCDRSYYLELIENSVAVAWVIHCISRVIFPLDCYLPQPTPQIIKYNIWQSYTNPFPLLWQYVNHTTLRKSNCV